MTDTASMGLYSPLCRFAQLAGVSFWLSIGVAFAAPGSDSSNAGAAQVTPASADALRKEWIIKAIPGVNPDLIFINNGQGKVDADPKRKLSYYIYTKDPQDPESDTFLIPMATSRFDENNYQTDEWWDAHKDAMEEARRNGTPAPHQDRAEVRKYLQDNGLSTNPDVFVINAAHGRLQKTQLKQFLLAEYLKRFTSEDGYVWLYRGAEKPGELAAWKRGEVPRGVRYWTPDINYGWRYGRKNTDFLNLLMIDEAPVFKFKIPKDQFIKLVRDGHLVLGTELTKSAHSAFARTKRFTDSLTGGDYLGEGKYGLELEIRGDRAARQYFPRYFAGAVTTDDLANGRVRQIREGTNRLALMYPDEAEKLKATAATRIAQTEAERGVLNALHSGASPERVQTEVSKLGNGNAEIAAIDYVNLRTFATNYKSIDSCVTARVGELLQESSR